MRKLVFLAAVLTLSMSPLDAAQNDSRNAQQSGRGSELRRDVERISREIYPPRSDSAPPRRSLAAGATMKKSAAMITLA